MPASDYSFPAASRLIAVELKHTGSVRPFMLTRNTNGELEPADGDVGAVSLKKGGSAEFQVNVPYSYETSNSGIVSLELANWGPREYLFTTACFVGTTWPFGQEFKTGISPGAPHVKTITYTFKQRGTVWNLGWSVESGVTKQSGSLDIVDDAAGKSAGATAYVVLRLAGQNYGNITFTDLAFGAKKQMFFGFAGAPTPSPAAGAAVRLARRELFSTGEGEPRTGLLEQNPLGDALREVYREHKRNWTTAQASGIPDEYMEPIRQALFQRAVEQAQAALGR